jgi:hypothetical protein
MPSEDLDPTSDKDAPDMAMDSTVVMPVKVSDMAAIPMVVMPAMVVMDAADLLPQRFQ